jgi:hypothetical protein
MRFEPELARYRQRINCDPPPPPCFVTVAMELAVMSPA